MSETPKIRIRALRKTFGPKVVLDGIDLEVADGESLVVIGGSGTGKSVLLKCILGILTPDGGSIEVDGVEAHHPVAARARGDHAEVRHAVPGCCPVRQPAGMGERRLPPAARSSASAGARRARRPSRPWAWWG